MIYPTRVEIVPTSEENPDGKIYHDVTDEWVLAYKPPTLLIMSDKAQITGDGVDTATITVQLRTPMLIDGSHEDVLNAETVEIQIDDGTMDIVLGANGTGTTTINALDPGAFEIRGITYDSNIVELEVV